jgi:uncharacterized membrane protein YcaP (DUF421 family)
MLGIALRISFMYVYALLVLRLSGKRSIGQLSALDFVVAGVLGDLFDDAIWGEVPLALVVTSFATIFLMHMLVTAAAWRSVRLERLLCGTPAQVVVDGKLAEPTLLRERMHPENVKEALRERGVDRLADVQTAHLEPNGHISAIKQPSARPIQYRDLARRTKEGTALPPSR